MKHKQKESMYLTIGFADIEKKLTTTLIGNNEN